MEAVLDFPFPEKQHCVFFHVFLEGFTAHVSKHPQNCYGLPL